MVGDGGRGLRGLDGTAYHRVGGPPLSAGRGRRAPAGGRPAPSRAVKPSGRPSASSTSASTTSGNGTCRTSTS